MGFLYFILKGDIFMSYVKSIVPMNDFRLFMDMESGSVVIVDLSVKLNTIDTSLGVRLREISFVVKRETAQITN
jgi:hypothetical protein